MGPFFPQGFSQIGLTQRPNNFPQSLGKNKTVFQDLEGERMLDNLKAA